MILSNTQIQIKIETEELVIQPFYKSPARLSDVSPPFGLHANHYGLSLADEFIVWNFIVPDQPRVLPAGMNPKSPEFVRHMQTLEAQENTIEPGGRMEVKHCNKIQNPTISLGPAGVVIAKSVEHVRLPSNLMALVTPHSDLTFVGVSFTPFILPAGYNDKIALKMHNSGMKIVKLTAGAGVANVVFMECTESIAPFGIEA